MKTIAKPASAWGKIMVVALVISGLLLSGSGIAWADRGSDRHKGRQEVGREGSSRVKQDNRPGQYRSPEKVPVVRQLPRGHRRVVVNNNNYYVHDNRYYTRGPGGYIVVPPPTGAVFATLPFGSVTVTIGGIAYSRYGDVYYRPARHGYVVVKTPRFPPAAAYRFTVLVQTAALNVRSGPGQHFAVIGQTWQGQSLAVTGHASGWYHVVLPGGNSGWVMSEYTRMLSAG
jgi:hypothetical protein